MRRAGLLAIVVVSSGTVWAAPKDLDQRLAACTETAGALGPRFTCPHDVGITYFPEEPTSEHDKALETLLTIKRARGLAVSLINFKIGSVKGHAIEAVQGNRHELSAFVPSRRGFGRLVTCTAGEAVACAPYWEAFAARFAKQGAPSTAQARPWLNMNFVEVPKGCKASNASTIECGTTQVRWLEAPDFDFKQIAANEVLIRQKLGGEAASFEKYTCVLAGAPAECREYHGKGSGVVWAYTQASNQRQLVFCSYKSPTTLTKPPAPCDAVLQFFKEVPVHLQERPAPR